jgi:hypothetical protein
MLAPSATKNVTIMTLDSVFDYKKLFLFGFLGRAVSTVISSEDEGPAFPSILPAPLVSARVRFFLDLAIFPSTPGT